MPNNEFVLVGFDPTIKNGFISPVFTDGKKVFKQHGSDIIKNFTPYSGNLIFPSTTEIIKTSVGSPTVLAVVIGEYAFVGTANAKKMKKFKIA